MQVRKLEIAGAVEFIPSVFPDHRGLFVAPFQEDAFVEAVGRPFRLAQTNHSVSRRGTVRGVHFSAVPPGQAKYVYCPRGALLDIVVDIRVGSPTFGRWEAVRLDSLDFHALYLAEGLGHALVALEDDTLLTYLCSTGYRPASEHGINPLDPELGLPLPQHDGLVLSDKDRSAPTLREAQEAGLLPRYEDCLAWYGRPADPGGA
ncbi:dTDP-4-keto-6-deoxy-D-glucose epimerase [Actinoalloteichus sp. AHMU CJ021]|uniref:dTDP-4-dehydrorhamnose 3,5-epimerase n=1 Tax=Actinoalloteichus caeruleus DSM 43889 TaxID=1120930 RepID=A0ABT1JNL5_ACTCY|nr:dTDP-4-dehydrorhamnose 3,5-epimerase [Actinoalloteichus caeruleus]AUS79437.1 dTDP-4-keto-6-deoxy-D-glucose epimerase [Actinoalloteichus sp. AHMU CJ021]MCP2333749.1 dTDP-4-dehydrorhamnose 3,5-epimerase [Actinoalloteichus caeruleus DSM 43889]